MALVIWHESGRAAGGHDAVLGAGFAVAAVLLSAVGSLAASRKRSRGFPSWPDLVVSMVFEAGRPDALTPPPRRCRWAVCESVPIFVDSD